MAWLGDQELVILPRTSTFATTIHASISDNRLPCNATRYPVFHFPAQSSRQTIKVADTHRKSLLLGFVQETLLSSAQFLPSNVNSGFIACRDIIMATNATPWRSSWNPADKIFTWNGLSVYRVATTGDAWIAIPDPNQVNSKVMIQVSTVKLSNNSGFLEAQFIRWPGNTRFTINNPLVMHEPFHPFVSFLHICHEDDRVPESAGGELLAIARVADGYLFEGCLPDRCSNYLNASVQDLPSHEHTKRQMRDIVAGNTNIILPRILEIAYMFNLSEVFATASRAALWSMSPVELSTSFATWFQDLLPLDIGKAIQAETERSQEELLYKLPSVFHPDLHGDKEGGCHECASVSQVERWRLEIINKSYHWKH